MSSNNNDNDATLPATAMEAVKGLDLTGKIYLVTGAYSGLGAATSKALLSAGGTVIVAGRNAKLQQEFVDEMVKALGVDTDKMDMSHQLDLSDLKSVQKFANYIKDKYPMIDVLMANGGVMNTPCGTTKQGLEIQMGINAVGHFLLCKILANQTKRQVWVSSRGHSIYKAPPPTFDNDKAPPIDIDAIDKVDDATYSGFMRYQQSKLANILLAKQFKLEYAHNNMETVTIHPGLVQTNLFRHGNLIVIAVFQFFQKLLGKGAQTPDEGARTQTMVAVLPKLAGDYYGFCKVDQEAKVAKNMDDAKKLYDYCDKVTKEYQS